MRSDGPHIYCIPATAPAPVSSDILGTNTGYIIISSSISGVMSDVECKGGGPEVIVSKNGNMLQRSLRREGKRLSCNHFRP